MEQPLDRHDEHPRLDTRDSGSFSSRPPLTFSTLRELKGDASPQTAQPVSPIMSRRTSLDSDRFSTVSGLTSYYPNNPTNVNPRPAYVAPFGASQVASEHQSNRRVSSDEEGDFERKDDVQFSEPALALVNAFLDQLLYSFLLTARSTSLLALRPAITEVLKHRLAKDAIASAEDELAELLAGGDDEEEMESNQKLAEKNRSWDLELVWKRTRLRVMVYMRLGEMEDEDEQRYVKEEQLFHGSERRFSQSSGLVSWAAAIFLTSVLEYVAEQTLQVAAAAANTRARRQSRAQRMANGGTGTQAHGYLVVEAHDVEKVALNSTLGRLWRTWRKALRNNAAPGTPTHRSSASIGRRENMISAMSQRRSSFGTAHEGSVVGESRPMSRDEKDDLAEVEYPEHVMAANIPLPIGDTTRDIDEIVIPGLAPDPDDDGIDAQASSEPYSEFELGPLVPLPLGDEKRDVDEIEVPGLARDPDAEDDDTETVTEKDTVRRNSFAGITMHRTEHGLPTPEHSNPESPTQASMSPIGRQRSMSLPTPARTPLLKEDFVQNSEAEDAADEAFDETEVGAGEKSPDAVGGAEDEKSGAIFPWMAAGAATVTAAAATAGAWVLGSNNTETEQSAQPEQSTVDLAAPAAQARISNGLSGLIQSASQEDVGRHEQARSNDLLDVKKDSSQQSLSDKDIEELDKRKSLVDIKSMMIVNSPSAPASGQESPQKPLSPMRSESSSSYAFGNRGVSEEEGPEDVIGVARTADVPATLAPGAPSATSPKEDTQEARGTSNRPARLTLGESSRTVEIPANQDQPLTPRTLQRQFLDLTSESEAPEQGEQNRSPPKQSQRASLANGAQQSPSLASSPYRSSFNAPVEKNGTTAQQNKSSPDSHVQDHPVIQRMASLKSNEPKSPRSPKPATETDKAAPLTSASIRGPEDFDMFVQGVDTLKYTLTPENVRYDPVSATNPFQNADTEASQGPSNVVYARKNSSPKAASPVEMDATSSRVGRSVVPKQARTSAEEETRSSKRRSISRPSAANTSTHRKSGLMAREPRVMTESTRDFADFIRSTGPQKDTTVVPILANASTTSLHSLRSAHINGAVNSRSSSPSGDRRRSLSRPSGEEAAVPPVPPVPARPKNTMQPRGPTSVSGGSAELIDFIRSGPDEVGKHRISRTVAPFRTTMDSDQFKDLSDRISTERAADLKANTSAPSEQSTAASLRSSSQRTSANSRSALLSGPVPANQTAHPAYSGQPQKLTENKKKSQDGERKRFRSKDPYAMYDMDDDEDEDEDLLTSLPKQTRNDMSLMDFLNNSEPPSSAPPQPLINPNSAQARNIINNARTNGLNSQRSVSGPEARARSVPNSGAPRSGYTSPAVSLPSRQGTRNGSITSATGRPPKMQARGGAKDISMNDNVRDLANFLRTGPPEDPDSAPAPVVGRGVSSREAEKAKKKTERKKTGSGFFGRSKKKNTYLDMP